MEKISWRLNCIMKGPWPSETTLREEITGGARSKSGRGEQVKAKGSSKGNWEPMKRDD